MKRAGALLAGLLVGGCTAIAPFGELATADAGSDGGPALDAGDGRRVVFLTSETYTGNLAGVEGADARCASLGRVRGDFRAWISVPGDPVADRFDRAAGPYVRVDGALVAASWEDLTNGELVNLIDLDENGTRVDDGGLVWTGTSPDGAALDGDAHCERWTVGEFGTNGGTGAYDDDFAGQWSHYTGIGDTWPCSNRFHLYCFER